MAQIPVACEEKEKEKQNEKEPFVFSSENFRSPDLPHDLDVIDVPLVAATDESLEGYGKLVRSVDEYTVQKGNFEIVRWPQPGWRSLDPDTGDEAGTTEGTFDLRWEGDYYYGRNNAVSTTNNVYLDGLGATPQLASRKHHSGSGSIYLWMSDYHPDGAQLFFPQSPISFVVCLGLSSHRDDIKPHHMRAFLVPAGMGVMIHPGTWHNGVYVLPQHTPCSFLTRQGKVHARISCSWAGEFKVLLRVPLTLPTREE
ncbi:RmlC-like cupin domain-containing protein [Ochromonadaceae sp. CCMP2298]|nr:RmlC-like cupin domain-containing protein [Ochromonadaceae sp. CCMP2298]